MDMKVTRKTILIADDEEKNRTYLDAILTSEGYATLHANDGKMAFELIKEHQPDLILLDAMMPVLNGFELAEKLKSNEATKVIPIIMITALVDRNSRMRALQCGVEEFVTKPVDRAELWIRVRNLLRLKEYNDFLTNYSRTLEVQVEERTEQLLTSYFDSMFSILRAAEFRDKETGDHIHRIAFFCKELAANIGMGSEFCDTIYHASPLHDVGKIGIPDRILLKPGPHTPDEWEIMKTHAALGYSILGNGNSTSPFTMMGAEIALNHHERWNGTGYPNGIKGEAIPLAARIMVISDVYDALRSKRPYKPAYTHEHALQIMLKGDGRTRPEHFDPMLLNAFEKLAERFREIFEEHEDLPE
ncbi:HD domain-containing phosphohydrolase [Methylophilus sp. Leaf414]|uniref:HD domain-containing phosphohydrolase n=1 Tax=Methylophilus sp. Leaf414 TaxID=1736371 RepID=UPI0006F64A79|nr:HD domain-containing phosphohydrolase [Methylophilus sp. Leaf414]KQT34500.1 two-component system response regulator [Methylophilus sp. Leaf414]